MGLLRAFGVGLLVGMAHGESSKCGRTMCISLKQSGAEIQFTLESQIGLDKTGWMAVGFGQHMVGPEMVVVWPNDNGNATLSRRKATRHFMPLIDPAPTRIAALAVRDTHISSDVKPTISFTVSSPGESEVQFIWAFGSTRPSSSQPDALFTWHADRGSYTLDVAPDTSTSTPIASSSTSAAPSSSATISVPSTSTIAPSHGNSTSGHSNGHRTLEPYQRKILTHGMLGTLGFLVVLPSGALLARFARTFTSAWFRGHFILNFYISAAVILSAITQAVRSVQASDVESVHTSHKWIGILLCFLYLAQMALGAIIHWRKPSSTWTDGRRPPHNYLHAVLGLVIIGLAFYQVRTGYAVELPRYAGINAPKWAAAAWTTWAVILPLAYAGGLVLLPRQWRQEAQVQYRPLEDDIAMREVEEPE